MMQQITRERKKATEGRRQKKINMWMPNGDRSWGEKRE